jgi:hypothetical protein
VPATPPAGTARVPPRCCTTGAHADIPARKEARLEQIASWVAPIATTIAALMVAINAGSRITGFGFIVFSIGSIAWAMVGYATDQMNLVWQNVVLLVINIIGVWQWLGLRARYEKGAQAATDRSLRARVFGRR